jgi:DNA-binding transcriptional regulator GbsR (MarR family)
LNEATERTRGLPVEIEAVCAAAGTFIEYWGFKAVHGRVWALLAVSKEPLSQTALAEALGISRALVSATIAQLQGYDLVRPAGPHHHAPWQANFDVWPTIAGVLQEREAQILNSAKEALQRADEALGECPDQRFDRRRIRAILGMTEMMGGLLHLLIAFRDQAGVGSFAGMLTGRARRILTRVTGFSKAKNSTQ